jgi:purine nucleosidase/pyrimidine-specific ribonucleoside hydrolase
MKRVIIDTDAGVDDALAIILALRSPELKVEAITTVSGNVHVDLCTENVLRVLQLFLPGDVPPVARGEDAPLYKPIVTAPEVHGIDGLGGLHSLLLESGDAAYPSPSIKSLDIPAYRHIAALADHHTQDISIIAIGPLTNLAKAITNCPDEMKGVSEIIVMGGAVRAYGNTTTVAEFNIFVDPDAAQVVLGSGIPVILVPLDVTEQVCLMMEHINFMRESDTNITRFVADLVKSYMEYHASTEGLHGCYLHDPLAVGIAVNPNFCKMQECYVRVETGGNITTGMTVCDLRPNPLTSHPPNARVCTEVDSAGFMKFFTQRVSRGF